MQCSPTDYIINYLNVLMMAQLQLKEKHEETHEKIVEGVIICIECGSPNTTILTKAIYCRDCRSFKLFKKRKPSEFLSQDEELGVFRVK
ncbi:MAG: hypothetical protein QQN53_06050 [Nitrosopumilus sp.]|nr:hypothetical protein [Nitrososphaerota archaeon]